ncbi:MAG TPA: hypothetical protein VM580_21175 [Labilithrix sp.]|nr:hypothetical protein [Labilithrix sp.]
MSVLRLVVASLVALVAFSPRMAHAERELIVPFHEAGHLVFDQLSGLRVNPSSGVSYAGPAGVTFRSEKADALVPGRPAT